jgi:hypothetical protein
MQHYAVAKRVISKPTGRRNHMTRHHSSAGSGTSRSRRGNGRTRNQRDRQLSVRAVRRNPPDLRKLSRAIVAIALAQAEAEAEAQLTAQDADSRGDGQTEVGDD